MAKKPVFYSFHFANDVMRVQQIRNLGAIEENTPVNSNEWESIKQRGSAAIEKWIDDNMKYKQCVAVLIGSETASRPWVQYEINKAWRDKRGLLGIYIHNLKCPNTGTCAKGPNPFDVVKFSNGAPFSNYIKCYDPGDIFESAYTAIKNSIEGWVEKAISERKAYG